MLLVCLFVAGCDYLPRDPADTSVRVTEQRIFKVGLTEPAVGKAPEVHYLLLEIERRTGARPQMLSDTGEHVLAQLESGSADLVIGWFKADSPWKSDVSFGPPLRSTGPADNAIELKAAARNGENRWIMTMERASRSLQSGDDTP